MKKATLKKGPRCGPFLRGFPLPFIVQPLAGGEGGGASHQKGGAGPSGPKVAAAFGGRLCRRVVFQGGEGKILKFDRPVGPQSGPGSKGSEGSNDSEGCRLPLRGNDYKVSVTGFALCHYDSSSFRAVVQAGMIP